MSTQSDEDEPTDTDEPADAMTQPLAPAGTTDKLTNAEEEPAIADEGPTDSEAESVHDRVEHADIQEEPVGTEEELVDTEEEPVGTEEEPVGTEEVPTDMKDSGAEKSSGTKQVPVDMKEHAGTEEAPSETAVAKPSHRTSRSTRSPTPNKNTGQHSSSVSHLTDGAGDIKHAGEYAAEAKTPVRRSARLRRRASATTGKDRIEKTPVTGKTGRKANNKDNIGKKRTRTGSNTRKSDGSDSATSPSSESSQTPMSSAIKRKASELEAEMEAETKGPITRSRKKRISSDSIRSAELSFQ